MSHSVRVFCAVCVVALALVVAGPVAAQQVVQQAVPTPQAILSPEATAALEAAMGGELPADVALLGRAFMFPSMQGGGTLVMMGFRMDETALMFGAEPVAEGAEGAEAAVPRETAGLEIFGALLQDGAEIRRIGTTAKIPKASGDGVNTATFSFGDTMPAGSYEVVWGIRDVVSGKTAMRRDALEVPNFVTGGLSTSSVLMVQGNPAAAPGIFQPNTVYYGVRILTASFMDNLTHEFSKSTPSVMLIFLVSGAQFDAAAQAPKLELDYAILDADGKRIWRAPPQPLNRATVGQPIPLNQIKELEAGNDYEFQITAKDLIAGTDTVTMVPFRVVE